MTRKKVGGNDDGETGIGDVLYRVAKVAAPLAVVVAETVVSGVLDQPYSETEDSNAAIVTNSL